MKGYKCGQTAGGTLTVEWERLIPIGEERFVQQSCDLQKQKRIYNYKNKINKIKKKVHKPKGPQLYWLIHFCTFILYITNKHATFLIEVSAEVQVYCSNHPHSGKL